MSTYTTQVRYICENANNLQESEGFENVERIIDGALGYIFDFNFPIFDENYRSVLERKIIRHFYTREIGLETVGLWKLKLATKMNEIMPYYNQLYKTVNMIVEPLVDVDYTKLYNGEYDDISKRIDTNEATNTSNTNRTTNGNDNSTNYSLYSETPQGGLIGVDSGEYLTNATKNINNGTITNIDTTVGNGTTSSNGAENINRDGRNKSEENIKGNMGIRSKAKLLEEYRKSLINIDMMIIRDLEPLFMMIW